MSDTIGTTEGKETHTIDSVYDNIDKEQIIKEIKDLEAKLTEAKEAEKQLEVRKADNASVRIFNLYNEKMNEKIKVEKGILEQLLDKFFALLKTKYGPLGYLALSTPANLERLYDVHTDMDFYALVDGSRIRVLNKMPDDAAAAGSGRKWTLERELMIEDTAEAPPDAKIIDEAVKDIISSVRYRIQQLRWL